MKAGPWFRSDEQNRNPCVGVDILVERLLCVSDHLLPNESQRWVLPAYLGRIERGAIENRELAKIEDVRWFSAHELPKNLKNATSSVHSGAILMVTSTRSPEIDLDRPGSPN